MTVNYKKYEFTGKSIEDAIESGLKELNLTRDQVKIEVKSEGAHGLFGLVGAKSACVKISVPHTEIDDVRDTLESLLKLMGIVAVVHPEKESDDRFYMNIETDDAGILIGKRGETLNALQYMVNLIVNRNRENRLRIVLDLEGYRDKRDKTLTDLSLRIADKARKSGKSIALEPMNAQERRIIHVALAGSSDIETHSSGTGKYRKVIISLKQNSSST